RTSIVATLHIPAAARVIAAEAIQRAILECDIPFIARPGIGSPPITGSAPGSGHMTDFAADALGQDEDRLTIVDLHASMMRRAEYTKDHATRRHGDAATRRL